MYDIEISDYLTNSLVVALFITNFTYPHSISAECTFWQSKNSAFYSVSRSSTNSYYWPFLLHKYSIVSHLTSVPSEPAQFPTENGIFAIHVCPVDQDLHTRNSRRSWEWQNIFSMIHAHAGHSYPVEGDFNAIVICPGSEWAVLAFLHGLRSHTVRIACVLSH